MILKNVILPASLLGIVQDLVVEDGIVECQTESNWVSWLSKHVMKVENIIEVIFDFVTFKSIFPNVYYYINHQTFYESS